MATATVQRNAVTPGTGTSLYVHVPFCVVKCGYCDFNSYVARDGSQFDRFLDALAAELGTVHLPEPPISVFLGGGTPTHLDPARLERLFAILAERVDLRRCGEVTMEANPESVTAEKAALALAAGVNRFSMGVQSFQARHLRFLDRAHDAERARAAFGELRSAGCENISIDLIFGVPGETLAEWDDDLQQALALRSDHLSAYNLIFEPGTALYRERERGRVQPNDEEDDRTMFVRTRQALADAGFDAYEISNFAGRGGPCRHNDHYWLQGDYVGIGPGASSHRNGVRWTNLKALEAWAEAALHGLPPTASAETLTPRQRAGEAMWLGLRRSAGIDLQQLEARLQAPAGSWFAALIAKHEAEGLLAREGMRLRLTPAGVFLADRVGSDFLAPG
jgi:oxygen-independent coproporphyrinogen-3 oxidase